MANRSQKQQTAHDKGVRAEARELNKKGWNVKADHLAKWPNPPKVNGRYPDVYATKNGNTRIVEIETSRADDSNQHTSFRRHAGQKSNTQFYGRVVDSGGNRRQTFE